MPTDTLYGIVGRAEDKEVVEKIYKLRKRNLKKPCMILISRWDEVKKFGIDISQIKIPEYKEPTSYILDCPEEKFGYLHRGTQTLAFRVPNIPELKDLLKEVGPLIAPSANTEALPPAENIEEAKKYFGDNIDLYVDGGIIKGKASKVIKLHKDGSVSVIRE